MKFFKNKQKMPKKTTKKTQKFNILENVNYQN